MIDSGGLKERRGRERERGRRDERGTGEVEERGEGASGSRFRGQNQQRPRDPQRFILIIPFGIFSLALHGVETSILIKEVSPPAAHWSRAKGQISRRDFRSIRGGGFHTYSTTRLAFWKASLGCFEFPVVFYSPFLLHEGCRLFPVVHCFVVHGVVL